MNQRGRVAIVGAISEYNSGEEVQGMYFSYKSHIYLIDDEWLVVGMYSELIGLSNAI